MTSHTQVGLLVLGFGLATAVATAQDCPRVASVLPYGPPDVVTVDGSTAYLGIGRGVWVVDQSDPTAPRSLARVPMPARVRAIAVASHKAYVALGEDGIRVLDVTDPAEPVQLSTVRTPGTAQGLAVGLGCLYVAAGEAGLCAVERSSPPVLVGCVDTLDARDVAVEGNHAYVAEGAGGLVIVDVSLPFAMRVVGSAPMNASAVEVGSGIAYVGCGWDGLRTVDVRKPTAPFELGRLETETRVDRLAVETSLILTRGNRGVLVIDVSHPATPVAVGTLDFRWAGSMVDVSAHGSIATLATGNGVAFVGFSRPSNPAELGRIVTDSAAVVEVAGSITAVGLGPYRGTVDAISVVDPAHRGGPHEVAVVESDRAWIAAFAASGDHLYLLQEAVPPSRDPTLRVIDLSTPAEPRELGAATLAGPVELELSDVAAEGDYAYVPIDASLRVVDISNPLSPVEVASLALDDYGSSVEVDGDRVFVGVWDSDWSCLFEHLDVIDVSHPSHPVLLDNVLASAGIEVEAKEGLLAVLGGSGCQYQLSLEAGLLQATAMGGYELIHYGFLWSSYVEGISADIDRLGQLVFVSMKTDQSLSELRVFDNGTYEWYPDGLVTIAFPAIGGLATAGDLLLVTDRELGLLVLDPSCVAACYGDDPRVGPCPVEEAQ